MSWEHIRIVLPCFWAGLGFLLVYSVVPTSLAILSKNMGMFLNKSLLKAVLFVYCHFQTLYSEATFTCLSHAASTMYEIMRMRKSC